MVSQCRLFMWYPGTTSSYRCCSAWPCSGSHFRVTTGAPGISVASRNTLPTTLNTSHSGPNGCSCVTPGSSEAVSIASSSSCTPSIVVVPPRGAAGARRGPAARPSGLELVAQAADGEQEGRVRRVGLDLGAQPLDVDVEGLGVAHVVRAPDPVDQLHAGEHAAGIAHQELQQVELLERQRDLRAVHRDHVPVDVHPDGG